MPTNTRSGVYRVILWGLLLLAYLYAWIPVRTLWISHGAGPVLKRVATESMSKVTVEPLPGTHSLHIVRDDETWSYTAPAGIRFLLPGAFLILIAPRRPRLGLFFSGHVILGVIALSLLAGSAAGSQGGALAADFVQSYAIDAYSLAIPVLVIAGNMGSSPHPSAAKD